MMVIYAQPKTFLLGRVKMSQTPKLLAVVYNLYSTCMFSKQTIMQPLLMQQVEQHKNTDRGQFLDANQHLTIKLKKNFK